MVVGNYFALLEVARRVCQRRKTDSWSEDSCCTEPPYYTGFCVFYKMYTT